MMVTPQGIIEGLLEILSNLLANIASTKTFLIVLQGGWQQLLLKYLNLTFDEKGIPFFLLFLGISIRSIVKKEYIV
jgi:hypothetical protein